MVWEASGVGARLYALIAVSAMLAAGTDAFAQEGSATEGTVQIGALVPITGDASAHGADVRIAIGVAESDFNQYLQERGAGWMLDILIEDTATSPVIALDKLSGLKAKNVNAVVGTYSSAELRNVKGYSDNNGMILISFASTAPSFAIPNDSIFRFIPDDTNSGLVLAKLLEESGVTNVVPVWRGDGIIKIAGAEFAALGGTVDDGVRYSPEAVEFSAEMALLSERVAEHAGDVGADRVAVLLASFSEATNLAQSASQYDNLAQVKWIGTNAIVGIEELVTDPIASRFFESAGLTAIQFAPSQSPVYEEVTAAVADISGRTPAVYALSAYDAVWVLGLSMLAGGSTDAGSIVAEMPGVLEEYDGAIGKITLSEAGDLIDGAYEIWSVGDSQWVMTGMYDPGSDSITMQSVAMADDAAAVGDGDSTTGVGEAVPAEGEGQDDGGCLIATAAYGNELATQVQFLRELRDDTLLQTTAGMSFMSFFNQFYYSFSPAVADLERESPILRDVVRAAITPAVYTLGIMTHADSETSVLALGIAAICAIAGIYVAGPSLAAYAIVRRVRR